jgi:hypothetical protein
LHLASKALILFAVNDNPYADEADGGTHWTLLAYTRSDCTFSHYDSGHSGSNDAAAHGIAAKLAPVLGCDMGSIVLYTSAVYAHMLQGLRTVVRSPAQHWLQLHSAACAPAVQWV